MNLLYKSVNQSVIMSSQPIIDDNFVPMEISSSSEAPAEAPTLDHIIVNYSTTILNVEEFTCHYDADTDINLAIGNCTQETICWLLTR